MKEKLGGGKKKYYSERKILGRKQIYYSEGKAFRR